MSDVIDRLRSDQGNGEELSVLHRAERAELLAEFNRLRAALAKREAVAVREAVRALVHAAFHLLDDSMENTDCRISIDNDIAADDLRALSDALEALGIESCEDIDAMLASSPQTVPEIVLLQRDNLHASVVDAVSLLNKTFLTDEPVIRASHTLRAALVQYADAMLTASKHALVKDSLTTDTEGVCGRNYNHNGGKPQQTAAQSAGKGVE